MYQEAHLGFAKQELVSPGTSSPLWVGVISVTGDGAVIMVISFPTCVCDILDLITEHLALGQLTCVSFPCEFVLR